MASKTMSPCSDIDQGGFRVASRIHMMCMGERTCQPWMMGARPVRATTREKISDATRKAMARAAKATG